MLRRARQALECASLWQPPDIDKAASNTMNFVLLVEKNGLLCFTTFDAHVMSCMIFMKQEKTQPALREASGSSIQFEHDDKIPVAISTLEMDALCMV